MAKKKTPKRRAKKDPNSATNQYGLTPLQWRLVQCYPACDFNGRRAAEAAGYKGRDPGHYASRTLALPKVHEALQDLLRHETEFLSLSRARVIKAWMDMAFFNIADIGDNPGEGFQFEQFSKLPKSMVAAIEEVGHTVGRDGSVKMNIKVSKTKALEMLTKILRILEPDKTEESKGAFQKWLDAQRDGLSKDDMADE